MPLLSTFLHLKSTHRTTQLLITSLDYSSFIGRIAIGRLHRGSLKQGQQVSLISREGESRKSKIKELYVFEGLGKAKVEEVVAGDLCMIEGLDDLQLEIRLQILMSPKRYPPLELTNPLCRCYLP